MSRPPNFKTIVMSSILLEAYFRELSINVTIVPIGCQMVEISVKNGPIVIKSRTASISAAIFAAMFISGKKNRVGRSRKKNLNREVLIRDGRVTGNKQFFF